MSKILEKAFIIFFTYSLEITAINFESKTYSDQLIKNRNLIINFLNIYIYNYIYLILFNYKK